jgi:hypothetical protein
MLNLVLGFLVLGFVTRRVDCSSDETRNNNHVKANFNKFYRFPNNLYNISERLNQLDEVIAYKKIRLSCVKL